MKNLLFKLIGPFFAAIGVFGLAGSGILWNFLGRSLGLPSTIASLLSLMLGFVLLRPLARTPASPSTSTTSTSSQTETPAGDVDVDSTEAVRASELTTAESIAQELAASQKLLDVAPQVNFAPKMLLPGQGLPNRRRRPGASLKRYKTMAGELFVTK